MNSVYSKSTSAHIQLAKPLLQEKASELQQTPVCHSFGGCLGCHIHTLSGYGGCTSYEPNTKEDPYCLRLLTVIKGENVIWYHGTDKPISLHNGKSVLIFSANSFNGVFISEEESYIEISDIRFDCQYLTTIYQQMKDSLADNDINPLTENRPLIFDTSIEIQQFINQLNTHDGMCSATDHLYAVSQAYQCLSKLLNQIPMLKTNKKHDNSSRLSNRTLNKIRKAHAMITSEPGKNWCLNELCRQVCTNETSFKRGFKLLFNTTFSKLLQQTRMKIAAEELEHTDHPVIDISFKVGYSSPSHFTKLFKQHFGQNPLQYRKNHQQPYR